MSNTDANSFAPDLPVRGNGATNSYGKTSLSNADAATRLISGARWVATKADLEVTRRLHRVLHALDIELIDHLIFGGPRGAYTSFKHAGLL